MAWVIFNFVVVGAAVYLVTYLVIGTACGVYESYRKDEMLQAGRKKFVDESDESREWSIAVHRQYHEMEAINFKQAKYLALIAVILYVLLKLADLLAWILH